MSTDRLLPSSRRRGRSSRGKWVVFLLVVAALGYLLWHRTKVPAIAAHAWVAPNVSALPQLTACWLETGRFVGITASGVFVRHPRGGDFLVDSGNSSHFASEIAPMSIEKRLLLHLAVGQVLPTLTMPAAIIAAGAKPADLKAVLITHLHLDHLGGAMDLAPQLPIWTSAEELEFAKKARGTLDGVPAQMDVLATRGRGIAFQKRAYEVFDESADLFGDGSVVVVKLPGHTPGSLGVFLNISATRRLFLIGDAASELVEVEQGLTKHGISRVTDFNKTLAATTVALLQQLHEQDPGLLVIPAHDRAAFESAFGGGPRCIH